MIRWVPVNEGVPFTRISGAVPLALFVWDDAQFCIFPKTIHPAGGKVVPLKCSSNNTWAERKADRKIPANNSNDFFIVC
jgi:hypothetical protein